MVKVSKAIATVCGIGYIGKGAGTIASVAYCFIWILFPAGGMISWSLALLCAVLVLGIWSAGRVEKIWGQDSNRVVIDEVAGMMTTLLMVPVNFVYGITGLLLFRFFDIVKPFGIKKAERLHGGIGVMADDVLAGIYARFILQVIISAKIF
jgi:phosphatidylglycerophosphatase A